VRSVTPPQARNYHYSTFMQLTDIEDRTHTHPTEAPPDILNTHPQ